MMKTHWIALPALVLLLGRSAAQATPELTNSTQKISYALGMEVVRALQADDFDINLPAITAGVADMQAGKPALTPAERSAVMRQMKEAILARAVAKKEAEGAKHRQAGEAFLASNATKEGVQTKTLTAPDGTTAQLQYKVLKSGPPGASPQTNDAVALHFTGHLLDGTVFDSSAQRGGKAVFLMNDVIPGMAAALQMMKPGDQWQLFVPPSLAYADYGPPPIGVNSTLIYELELVSFSAANTVTPDSPAIK